MATDSTLPLPLRRELESIADLIVSADEALRQAAEHDFGRMRTGNVRAVVVPETPEALVRLVHLATREGLSLTPRGLGYSQSGQSLPVDGLSVDMRSFRAIDVSQDAETARCGCSVTWRDVLAKTDALGLAPAVMPANLDLSIGGTLSAGGMGSTSHRHGMAVSCVESITVVTGAGELLESGWDHRKDVLDAVLGGAGQFGFICSARLRLRRRLPKTRTFYLLYDDVCVLLADERKLMSQPWCTHLEGFASAAIQGLRLGPGGQRIPLARWFYGLHLSVEFDPATPPDDNDCLRELGFRELLHSEDSESGEFAGRYDRRFEMMRATGAWDQAHPWLECLLPYQAARDVLPRLIPELPPFLGDGHRIMPLAAVPRPGLLAHPDGGPVIGFAILPAGIPAAFESAAVDALHRVHDALIAVGGKRYLSGWLFEPDESAWRRHYGDDYETWCARKKDLDPHGILRSCLRPTV